MRLRFLYSGLILLLLSLLSSEFFPANAQSPETKVTIAQLTANAPYLNTGIEVNPGDSITIRQEGNPSFYPVGRTVPWVSNAGDPGCVADEDYTLPGVNCWAVVARIGNGQVFLVGAEYSGSVDEAGRLYLGINHKPPLVGSGSLRVRIIHNAYPPPPKPITPTPFLDLPWDYESKGMSFREAAMKINSYFDHEYPLVSVSLDEPDETNKSVINFKDNNRSNKRYSSHDGYDYGGLAKTKLNEPVLAAADGCAVYHYDIYSGNAIFIDHGNFYQTRYYHLMGMDLITKSNTECIPVSKGQMIGRVGFTGNVDPPGEDGSHLHFMVIEDKNKDGNFQDNIPDGLTDPYGWEGKDPDPWPAYTFYYNGQERTGNDSHYLWMHPLTDAKRTLTPLGGNHTFENAHISFDNNSTHENLIITLKISPLIKLSDYQHSVGNVFEILAHNLFNTIKTEFSKSFSLSLDFSEEDISLYDPDSFSIYSSSDGHVWHIETTEIDWEKRIATAEIDHLSYFALMGTLKDQTPPVTLLEINNSQTIQPTYSQPVTISLNTTDNSGSEAIEYTAYRVGNEDWKLYEDEIVISEPGDYTISYYSTDLSENSESVKETSFSIIEESPEISFSFDFDDYQFLSEMINDDNYEETTAKINSYTRKSTFTTQSEQTVTIVYKSISLLGSKIISLESIQYNQEQPIQLPENTFTAFKLKLFRNQIFSQTIWIKNSLIISSLYESKSDKSYVVSEDYSGNTNKLTFSGLKSLQLVINKGNLEVEY